MPDRTPWIVATQQPFGLWCRHCNQRDRIESPISTTAYASRARVFAAAHKNCPEPRRAQQGSGLPTRCQFSGGDAEGHVPTYVLWFRMAGGLEFAEALCKSHVDPRSAEVREKGGELVRVEDVAVIAGVS